MTRLALCFAGLPRITDVSTAGWRVLINQHDTDIFVHVWADSDPQQLQQWIAATYAPKTLIVENPIAEMILRGTIQMGDIIKVTAVKDVIKIEKG